MGVGKLDENPRSILGAFFETPGIKQLWRKGCRIGQSEPFGNVWGADIDSRPVLRWGKARLNTQQTRLWALLRILVRNAASPIILMTRRAGESYLSDDFGWQSDSEYEERLGILQPT